MKTLLSIVLVSLLVLTLTHCAPNFVAIRQQSVAQELADTTHKDLHARFTLALHDNRKLSRIVGFDSLFCASVDSSDSVVYVDEPLWANLDKSLRLPLAQCFQQKHQRFSILPAHDAAQHVWTARLSEDEQRLRIGLVPALCFACDLQNAKVVYNLKAQDLLLIPKRAAEMELWR